MYQECELITRAHLSPPHLSLPLGEALFPSQCQAARTGAELWLRLA